MCSFHDKCLLTITPRSPVKFIRSSYVEIKVPIKLVKFIGRDHRYPI